MTIAPTITSSNIHEWKFHSPAVNGDNLRCVYDAEGNCTEIRPCHPDFRTPDSDECLADVEERAWSSPIYVDFGG